ncbi:MAG: tetratricopeptide repeat protein [Pseudomonadota bacterium]|nr:tetratricopeptide repeat protein [Pseudomonadota bacterium]
MSESLKSQDLQARVAAAITHHKAGRFKEAELAYNKILHIFPDFLDVIQNLGVIAAATGRLDEAIQRFERAIKIDPLYPPALWNVANALRDSGRLEEAIKAYQRVIFVEPEHYNAARSLGFIWNSLGRQDRALDYFSRTLDLRRGENRFGKPDLTLVQTTRAKLEHDINQFRYLASIKRDGERFDSLARAYENTKNKIKWPKDEHEIYPLANEEIEWFGGSYNFPNHVIDAAEHTQGTVNQKLNVDEISKLYSVSSPGLVWFDNLLTEEALLRLQNFLLGSTVWFDFSHIKGFLAAYLEDGLACPLLLQIAEEIRKTFPQILGKHSLIQAWAFKGISGDKPIGVHVDDASVSINFWVTPDHSNDNPESGGLEIYKQAPPGDWKITNYDDDSEPIKKFLVDHEDQKIIVPYKENRAVLFDSRLFHGSNAPRFKSGYINHRINITMLFGKKTKM